MRSKGIVLILLSGVIALLLFLAILLLQMSRSLGRSAEAGLSAARARVASASGLEYAFSRLLADGFPRYAREPSRRGDDWAAREPLRVPIETLREPSYRHGEPWADTAVLPADERDNDADGAVDEADEGNGIWTEGEPFADLDGDGKPGAWSGRLRGGRAPFDLRFSLRVQSPNGRIPLNAGYLDPQRCALVTNAAVWPGVPVTHPYQLGLVHVLNNLGALVLPEGSPRREERAFYADGHAFLLSWLGRDLISSRPPGGYRSLEEVRAALLRLGYAAEECDAALPFLAVGEVEWQPCGGRALDLRPASMMDTDECYSGDGARAPQEPPAYAPVSLWGAPREVLQSLWMYLGGDGLMARTPGYVSEWARPCSYTGNALDFSRAALLIYADEAGRLAGEAALLRTSFPLTWNAFRGRLAEKAPDLFRSDAADLADPVNERTWLAAKSDLAFQAVAADPSPWDWGGPLRTWEGWGIDRDGDPSNGIQQGNRIPFTDLRRVSYPEGAGKGWPFPIPPPHEGGDRIAPQGLTLAPPLRFEAESLGRSGTVSCASAGAFRTGQCLELTTQEDFESLFGGRISGDPEGFAPPPGPYPVRDLFVQGIRAVDAPAALRFDERDEEVPDLFASPRRYAHVVSLPRWSPRTFCKDPALSPLSTPDGIDNDGDGLTDEEGEWNADGIDGDRDGYHADGIDVNRDEPGERNGVLGFSRGYGALALGSREGGFRGARLYCPFRTRADYDPERTMSLELDPAWVPPPLSEAAYRPPWRFWKPNKVFDRFPNPCMGGSEVYSGDGFDAMQMMIPVTAVNAHPSRPESFTIDAGSVEGWTWLWGTFQLGIRPPAVGELNPADFIFLRIEPGAGTEPSVRVTFQLFADCYGNTEAVPRLPEMVIPRRTYLFPAGKLPGGLEGPFHFVLSLQRHWEGIAMPNVPWTEVRLWLNGSNLDPDGNPMRWEFYRNSPSTVSDAWKQKRIGARAEAANVKKTHITFLGDDLRFHDACVDGAAAYASDRSRFVDSGTFVSPLYVLDAPARLDASQFLGLIPPGFPSGSIAVEVEGYRNDVGTDLAAGFPVLLSAGEVGRLASRCDPVRSFRYRVLLSAAAAPRPLQDSPVFESIWLTMRGNGRTPEWTAWESR